MRSKKKQALYLMAEQLTKKLECLVLSQHTCYCDIWTKRSFQPLKHFRAKGKGLLCNHCSQESARLHREKFFHRNTKRHLAVCLRRPYFKIQPFGANTKFCPRQPDHDNYQYFFPRCSVFLEQLDNDCNIQAQSTFLQHKHILLLVKFINIHFLHCKQHMLIIYWSVYVKYK